MSEWVEQATCRSVDPEVWYPDYVGQEWDAVKICAQCPVQRECMTASFDQEEQFGVWGGVTHWDRVPLLPKYKKRAKPDRSLLVDQMIKRIDAAIENRAAHKKEVEDRRLERNARNNQRIRDELKSRGLSSRGKRAA